MHFLVYADCGIFVSIEPNYQAASVFKALGDDNRLAIMLLIQREKELCVCELIAALELSQPRVSRYLAHLRAQHLLQDERRGQWVYYRLHRNLPHWVQAVLEQTSQASAHLLHPKMNRLAVMPDRPINRDCR